MTVTIDFETRSYANLKKVGPWAYSEHPTTDIICVCYGVDDQPIQEWWPGNPDIPMASGMPKSLYMAIATGHPVEAHNVAFERSIWRNVLAARYGWMEPLDHQWRDTMAVACYYALPAALDRLARALGYGGKDPEGARLITRYSKLYLKTAKAEIPDEDFFKFVDYCRRDVQIEQSISDELGDLPERELPIFLLDQEINMRGLRLDIEGITVASGIVDRRAEELEQEFKKLTGVKPSQRDKVIAWFAKAGLVLENLQADYLEDLIEDTEIPQGPARRALEIRLAINKASTKKLDMMARQAGADGCCRWQTRYHGAGTGRITGSGFQPLNLNRGFGDEVEPERLVADIMRGDAAWLDCVYGDAMDAIAKASRHWIMAGPGNKIIAGDFVSIEAVLLACLAGEQWKIDAFTRREPLYEIMGAKIHNLVLTPEQLKAMKKTHPMERFDGKTCLGAGTQVLTRRGWRRIIDVEPRDLLWDGIEWVSHGGRICQGVKPVLELAGVAMTPNHLVLCGQEWVEGKTVNSSAKLLRRALGNAMENLPSSALSVGRRGVFSQFGLSALVAQSSIWFRKLICVIKEHLDVTDARKGRQQNGAKSFGALPIYAPMTHTAAACLTGFPRVSHAANLKGTATMARGGFVFGRNGEKGLRGGARIYNIFSRYPGGISQNWRLIVLMWIKGMSRVICAFSPRGKELSALFGSYKRGSPNLKPVYDLVNAGPRRRFTILSNRGPLVVHNCELAFGYQGALGAWLKFDNSGRHTDERIIEICKAWRKEHPEIVDFWWGLERAAVEAVEHPGRETSYRQIGFEIVDEWLSMILPNGKRIWYREPQLRATMPRWHEPLVKDECAAGTCDCRARPQVTYMAQKMKQWKRTYTYGGKLAENATQATSREVLMPAIARAEEAGYRAVLTVYDEIVCEVPKDFGSKQEFEDIMRASPGEWAKGWPVNVEAWEGERYKK